MRRGVLFRSVSRVLGSDETVHEAAYMWSRHRWMVPYAAAVFAVIVVLAGIVGFEEWPTRIALGFAGVAVAVTATSDYRVLAVVGDRTLIFVASRVRQVATRLLEELPTGSQVTQTDGNVLATEWAVADRIYTVTRSSEQAMVRIAMWVGSAEA